MDGPHTRRRLLATASGLTAATLAGCFGSSDNDETSGTGGGGAGTGTGNGGNADTSAPAWPTFGVDHQNTGHNVGTTGPKDGIDVAWTVETDAEFMGAPVISGGTLFAKSDEQSLYAVDTASGERQWDVEFPGTEMPTVADGTVYATSSDHQIAAFDAETGDQRWVQDEQVSMSPLVVDGTVYAGGYQYGTQDGGDIGTNPIYEYDADTGDRSVLREYTYDEGGAAFPQAFAHADGALFFTASSSVRSVDLDTGDERWRFESDGPDIQMNRGSPVVVDGTVYATDVTDLGVPYLYAIDAESGDEQWRFHDDEIEQIEAGPSVADGIVYFLHNKSMTAIDADSGERLWTEQIRGLVGGVYEKPTIVDGVAYLNSGAWITGVDAATGEKLWVYECEEDIRKEQLVVSDNVIYATRKQGGTILAFEAA